MSLKFTITWNIADNSIDAVLGDVQSDVISASYQQKEDIDARAGINFAVGIDYMLARFQSNSNVYSGIKTIKDSQYCNGEKELQIYFGADSTLKVNVPLLDKLGEYLLENIQEKLKYFTSYSKNILRYEKTRMRRCMPEDRITQDEEEPLKYPEPPRYQVLPVAQVYGEPHIATLDGKTVFINEFGDFHLL